MGRKGGHSESLTYGEAVAVAGSEARLVDGINANTAKDWFVKKRVPAYRILQLIRAQLTGPTRGKPLPAFLVPPEGAMDDPTFSEAWLWVTAIWRLRGSPDENARRAWGELCAYLQRLYTSVVPAHKRKPLKEEEPP